MDSIQTIDPLYDPGQLAGQEKSNGSAVDDGHGDVAAPGAGYPGGPGPGRPDRGARAPAGPRVLRVPQAEVGQRLGQAEPAADHAAEGGRWQRDRRRWSRRCRSVRQRDQHRAGRGLQSVRLGVADGSAAAYGRLGTRHAQGLSS